MKDYFDYSLEGIETDLMMDSESVDIYHQPVLLNEVLDCLNLSPGKLIVDCTVGGGGHAAGILERVTPGGFLLGIDRDKEVLEVSAKRLDKYGNAFKLVHGNFKDLDLIMKDLNIISVDGFLFDLGFSSYQLEAPERGFSFRLNGPLDMRMDRTQKLTACDLVNNTEE
ncbi:MAG: 16S rRNA (cytosine(1402)-N(4))-methyltransferase, partial [Candidatus Omnitrophica bacterium]|nr:16S rRNA (cytosine(1402)-N(4))-methyltransferase [Candidatus Omnitrophota bacterium]